MSNNSPQNREVAYAYLKSELKLLVKNILQILDCPTTEKKWHITRAKNCYFRVALCNNVNKKTNTMVMWSRWSLENKGP